MKIQDLLRKRCHVADFRQQKKTAVIEEMIFKSLVDHLVIVTDFETFKEGI